MHSCCRQDSNIIIQSVHVAPIYCVKILFRFGQIDAPRRGRRRRKHDDNGRCQDDLVFAARSTLNNVERGRGATSLGAIVGLAKEERDRPILLGKKKGQDGGYLAIVSTAPKS